MWDRLRDNVSEPGESEGRLLCSMVSLLELRCLYFFVFPFGSLFCLSVISFRYDSFFCIYLFLSLTLFVNVSLCSFFLFSLLSLSVYSPKCSFVYFTFLVSLSVFCPSLIYGFYSVILLSLVCVYLSKICDVCPFPLSSFSWFRCLLVSVWRFLSLSLILFVPSTVWRAHSSRVLWDTRDKRETKI